MKRRAEADQQDLDTRRREASRLRRQESDPVSGRSPRVTVAHPKTLRGEAKEVDESGKRHLPTRPDAASDDSGAKSADDQTADGSNAGKSKANRSKADTKGKSANPKAKTETAGAADQPAEPTAGQQPTPDPATPAVVAVQTGSPKAPDTKEGPAGAALALPPVGQPAVSPTPAKADGANKVAVGDHATASAGTPEQTPIGAAAAAALSDTLATLDTGRTSPAVTASVATGTPQVSPLTITVVPEKQSLPAALPPMLQPAASIAGVTPPLQTTGRPATDPKPHTGNPAHADAGVPDPDAKPAGAPAAAQPYSLPPAQQLAALETGADDFDSSLPPDGSAPGWALHLAQGAAGRRADFVAQLRQHLQNLPIQEQVAVHVQRALREGAGRVSIQLSPDDLGRIHVKLDIDKDKRVTAAVTVERPGTLDLLQRDIKGLERALQDAGLNMESGDLSFSLGHRGDQEFAQDLGRSAAGGPSALASDARSEPERVESQAAQVADTAAGVVNLQV
ncbi:MAG TPA: flagellar hook-length control protein FliK [Dongiaceae bacterium]